MRKGVKVRRVVRRFELWPVAKVAFFFHLLCFLLTLGVLTGVWFVADRMGTVKNLEKLVSRLGWEKFEVHGDVLFRSAAMIGASMVIVATIGTVTLAFFYNMLSGIFGGLVLSVLQEHTDGSSGSRRQRRLAAKRAVKPEHRGEIRSSTPPIRPPNTPLDTPETPGTPETKRTLGTTKPKSPAVETRPTTRPRVGRTATPMAIPEGWEPDTVKSLFGDGDLEEEFAADYPDELPNELDTSSDGHPDLSWRTQTN
jgi:Transmembrane domain of unknown function (DUF3566)